MLGITTPFAFGYPVFEPVSCLAMTLVMLVTMAETTGDIVAVTEIVGKPMTESMLTKALRADGFSTALGGVFNTFPYTAFAQNIGLIGMTGVRSRYIVAVCGVMLMILGLFPKMAAVVASVPTMVLGGAGLACSAWSPPAASRLSRRLSCTRRATSWSSPSASPSP